MHEHLPIKPDRRAFLKAGLALTAGTAACAHDAERRTADTPPADIPKQGQRRKGPEDSHIQVALGGAVLCKPNTGGTANAALVGVPVSANDSYTATSTTGGAYSISVPANDYYDVLADPSDHRWEMLRDVWVGAAGASNKTIYCTHLPGTPAE